MMMTGWTTLCKKVTTWNHNDKWSANGTKKQADDDDIILVMTMTSVLLHG